MVVSPSIRAKILVKEFLNIKHSKFILVLRFIKILSRACHCLFLEDDNPSLNLFFSIYSTTKYSSTIHIVSYVHL